MWDDDLIAQASVLRASNCISEAEEICQRILSVSPKNAKALSFLGTLCFMSGRNEEGFKNLHLAEEIQPEYAVTLSRLGLAYQLSHDIAKAEHYYRLAIKFNPFEAAALDNLSGILMNPPRRLEEAEACYRRLLEINQGDTKAHYTFGKRLLLMGKLIEAWPHCEFRYSPDLQEKCTIVPNLPFPQWQGESLEGKSLVLWPEQGFGDYIQFIRYARLLKKRGLDRLTVVCPLPLVPFLRTMAGVDNIVNYGAAVSLHDYWSFPLSLPLHFDTSLENIPASLPYLHALPDRIAKWHDLLRTDSFRVGLVWKGSAEHKNDAHRSLPNLATLAPLWSVSGASFISLQKGAGEEETLQSPSHMPIIPLGPEICDFADTAAIVAQLDLVISVDTAIVHVAGALGKPCWVMLPYEGMDWRWLLDRADSPWYPGVMRLFRKPACGDWPNVIDQVVNSLKGLVQHESANKDQST